MNTLDDWPRVKRVLEGALAREGADRQAFLAEACGTDEALRARVDNLLAASDRVGTFLETPAAVLLDAGREDLSGRSVDSYQLVSRLGAGGMGEVYLAHDTKLDRPVALKFLSPELAADRTRLRRFHQEARAASSLNHPHIIVVHDFGELDGRPYMVTEFIEGETLRHALRRGALPMRDVLDIGVQLAGALAAAHARGLVHRDIKPENVMVRGDGYVKVLDFGLAKLATVTQSSDQGGVESHTQPGMVIGTPRYMSPEQARGLDLDARSDVWSLGVVLYEMATGGLPFAENSTATLFDVDRAVNLTVSERAARDLPPELLRVICTSLETVRDRRYQSAAELCADLKHVQRDTESARSGGVIGIVQRRLAQRVRLFGPRKLALVATLAAALGALVSVPLIRGNRVAGLAGVQKTVAVLPFDNVGGDGSIDYLRLALADEVATALSSTPSLAVRPMASSRRFAGGAGSPQEAGRQLRVDRIVIGHFSMHQSELRVTVEAVEVDSNRLLWRDTIAAAAADSIALRDGITSRIRDGLLPALGARRTHGSACSGPGTPKRMPSTSRASRSRVTPGRTGRRSPCSSARARSIRTTRTRGPRSGGATTTRGSTALAGSKRSGDRKRRSGTRWPWIQAISRPPSNLLVLQIDAGRLQDGYDIARRLAAQRPDSGESHFALSTVLRYGGLQEDSARECDDRHLPRPDQSTLPDLLGGVHSARAIRLGARLRPPGLRFRVGAAGYSVGLPAAGPARRCPRAAPSAIPGLPERTGARDLPRLHRALSLGRRPDRRRAVER